MIMDIYEVVSKLKASHQDLVIVTVTEKEGMSPSDVGKKMVVSQDGRAFGTVGGGSIEHYAINKAKQLLKERRSITEKYCLFDKDVKLDDGEIKLNMACGGKATLFYEFVGPKQYVYIFGAGHCGAALARILRPLDFYVTLIDYRKEIIDQLDDSANEKVYEDFVSYIEKNRNLDNRYVVVSTPSHIHDFDVLNKILELKLNPAYFGMLCSKKKIKDYISSVYEKYGKNINLNNFYAPIGLKTGGDSPEEVAISIASEILSIYYDKDLKNAHMRDDIKDEEKYFK